MNPMRVISSALMWTPLWCVWCVWCVVSLSGCEVSEVSAPQRIALNSELTLSAVGLSLGETSSDERLEHHLVTLTPQSLEGRIELSYSGCATQRVCLLIPQRLPYASLSARPYLNITSEAQDSLSEVSLTLPWRNEGQAGLEPLASPRALSWVRGEGERYALGCLEVSRASAEVSYPRADDEVLRTLLESLEQASAERQLARLPTPPSLSDPLPCAPLHADLNPRFNTPLDVHMSLNLYDHALLPQTLNEGSQGVHIALISGLSWSPQSADQARLTRLISQLNERPIDLVVLLGDITQPTLSNSSELFSLRSSLSDLNSPWVATPGDQDLWLSEPEWGAIFGASSFSLERGGLRLVALQTVRGGVSDTERALLEGVGAPEGLVWADEPTPLLRVLLSHHPLLSLEEGEGLLQRSDAIRLLNLAAQAELSAALSAGRAAPHLALTHTRVPDLTLEGAWLELIASRACLERLSVEETSLTASSACLSLEPRSLDDGVVSP